MYREIFRRDANDGVLHSIQILCFPNDRRVALVPVLPHLVTDHHNGMSFAAHIFFRLESAAQNRAHADRIKVVCGNDASDRAFGSIANAECRRRQLAHNEGLDQRAAPLEVDAIRIGQQVQG